MKRITSVVFILLAFAALAYGGLLQERQAAVVKARSAGGATPTPTPPEWDIEDGFGSDTSANYTNINGTFTISGGSVAPASTFNTVLTYHETTLGAADQTAQATFNPGTYVKPGVIVRVDTSAGTGYRITWQSTTVARVQSFVGTTMTFISDISYTGSNTWAVATPHILKVIVSGASIEIEIDWNDDGDFLDANESDMSTAAATTYSTGNYAGFAFTSGSTVDATLDNFKAKAN